MEVHGGGWEAGRGAGSLWGWSTQGCPVSLCPGPGLNPSISLVLSAKLWSCQPLDGNSHRLTPPPRTSGSPDPASSFLHHFNYRLTSLLARSGQHGLCVGTFFQLPVVIAYLFSCLTHKRLLTRGPNFAAHWSATGIRPWVATCRSLLTATRDQGCQGCLGVGMGV